MNRFLFFIFFLGTYTQGFAQKKEKLDSLLTLLSKSKEDTFKVRVLTDLSTAYTFSDPDKAVEFAVEGIELSENLHYSFGVATCLHELGIIRYYQGNYNKSLEEYLKALSILEKLQEKTNDDKMQIAVADNHHNIAKVYWRQRYYNKALESFNKALEIYKSINYKRGIAGCYNNMAGVFDSQGDYEKTLFYLKEFLKMAEESGSKERIATGINNIGLTYNRKGDYAEALNHLMKALKIREEINDIKGLAYSYTDIGNVYLDIKNPLKSLYFLNRGLEFANKANVPERIKESYESLAQAYADLKDYGKAYQYQNKLLVLKDSLFNAESSKQIAEMTAKYENDKKQKEIELLATDRKLQIAELERQTLISRSLSGGGALVLLLAIVAIRGYNHKKRVNKELDFKNQNISHAYAVIEEKNKDITDSIRYAKRIQEAILPADKTIKKLLPDSFILYKPKDIVSGDFYRLEEKNGKILFAAVDCTGHGVPGAFMSIVGNNLLNQAINEHHKTSPSEILDEVNKGLSEVLKQKEEEATVKDGMDLALCSLDIEKKTLEFAGANNPLWIIRNKALIEIKGDKFPVGIFVGEKLNKFHEHKINLQKNDSIYIFTDGYADQFGGEKGKKFKYSKLKELLLSISGEPMEKQKEILDETFETWRGNLEQVDDVCVIGLRI